MFKNKKFEILLYKYFDASFKNILLKFNVKKYF